MCLDRRRALAGLVTLAGWPLLSGCALGAAPLTVAAHTWPGYELMFLARREAWLDPKTVRLVDMESASASMAALERGEVDAAALTLDEALRVRARGTDVRVVLVFDISSGADKVVARPGITRLAALAGKHVGVEDSALGALMLHKALEAGGLAADEIIPVPLTIDQHLRAWEEGRVAALVTYEPVADALVRQGGTVLFDSSAIPNLIVDVLAVRAQALEKRHTRSAVRALLAAHFRALAHLHSHPDDAAYRLAHRLGGSGPKALESYRGLVLPDPYANRQLLAGGDGGLMATARELVALLHQQGRLPSLPEIDALTDASYLPRTEP